MILPSGNPNKQQIRNNMKVGGIYFFAFINHFIFFFIVCIFFTVIRVMKQVKKEQDNVSLSLKRRKILITNTLQYQSFFVCVCDKRRVLRTTVKNLNYLHMLKTDRKIKHRLYRFKQQQSNGRQSIYTQRSTAQRQQ